MVREIPLTQGKVALVDDEDYEKLSKYKWCAQRVPNIFYAVRTVLRINGKRQKGYIKYMHRVILDVPDNLHTDHIDGNGLNNQRSNLRIVTCRKNLQNRHTKKLSRFPGVSWNTTNATWCAQIHVGKKNVHLGLFKTEEEAYERYRSQANRIENGLPLTPNFSRKTSKYRGVYWSTSHKKWGAVTHIKGKTKGLGFFHSEDEAYNVYIRYVNGEK